MEKENKKKMNSTRTSTRLLNNLADNKLLNHNNNNNNNTNNLNDIHLASNAQHSSQTPSNLISNYSSSSPSSSSSSSSASSPILIKEISQAEDRFRKNSVNRIEDVEMTTDLGNCDDALNKSVTDEKSQSCLNQQQQQTIIIEGGLNGLQFHLKPEMSQNRHITLKVVPISSPPSNIDSSSILKSNINSTNHLQDHVSSVDFLDEKNSHNENLSQTTTVNLSESNQSVYFMMQTPIDLLTSSMQSNQSVKLNSSCSTSPTSSLNKSSYSPTQSPLSALTLQNIPPNSFTQSSSLANTTTVTLTSPVSSSSSVNSSPTAPKVVRDERRRANHNEVERRRRDNINKWIVELSKVIPDCSNDQSKHGQSKGGILEKTVQYLLDMKKANQQLTDHIRSLEKLKQENEILRQHNETFKKENEILKLKLGLDTEEHANASNSSVS